MRVGLRSRQSRKSLNTPRPLVRTPATWHSKFASKRPESWRLLGCDDIATRIGCVGAGLEPPWKADRAKELPVRHRGGDVARPPVRSPLVARARIDLEMGEF